MKIRHNREEDILLIEMQTAGTVDHAEQTGSVIAHFNAEDQLLLLEILDASDFLSAALKASLQDHQEVVLA